MHYVYILNHFEVGSASKEFEKRGSLNAEFPFANTAHQVFLIIIRVFQI